MDMLGGSCLSRIRRAGGCDGFNRASSWNADVEQGSCFQELCLRLLVQDTVTDKVTYSWVLQLGFIVLFSARSGV